MHWNDREHILNTLYLDKFADVLKYSATGVQCNYLIKKHWLYSNTFALLSKYELVINEMSLLHIIHFPQSKWLITESLLGLSVHKKLDALHISFIFFYNQSATIYASYFVISMILGQQHILIYRDTMPDMM